MYGVQLDWEGEERPSTLTLEDYESSRPRWCTGCGDRPVLIALQRVCRDAQLRPEQTVVVSGIGCSSRLPHYMHTYGFHGLHGRAFPVACGVRSRRPDLHVFVATGDGDCCAIGTSHWIHAIRYNMNMTVLMFDNNVYGLTKQQTSPTSEKGQRTQTHPTGAPLPALDPMAVTLGVTNASFVAQTVDWHPAHLYATIRAGHEHRGFSFIRILQRCPHFTPEIFEPCQRDSSLLLLLQHPDGIELGEREQTLFPNRAEHDPSDLEAARILAGRREVHPIGLFYRNENASHYEDDTQHGLEMSPAEKREALERAMDRFAV